MSERLSEDLLALLGEEGLVRLAEALGGRRFYVPHAAHREHALIEAVGEELAARLTRRYAPAYLRIPLVRELRARHYRAQGMSNGRIATMLGITETAVDKIFARMKNPPAKGSAQLTLEI